MAESLVSTRPRFRLSPGVLAGALLRSVLITSVILLLAFGGDTGRMARHGAMLPDGFAHPHAPDLAPLLAGGPAVLIHVATVLAALGVGVAQMVGVKGARTHRILGWAWVVFMLATAVTTLFIHRLNPEGLSPLHLFSAYALVAAPLAVFAARTHRVRLHGRLMTGMFTGALLVAGITSFLPGRLMWQVFFSWR